MIPPRPSHAVLLAASATAVLAAVLMRPVPQDPAYHVFADGRTVAGVPNGWNVLSNVPFLIAGWFGLLILRRHGQSARAFAGAPIAQSRRAYAALFAGTLLTAFGSAYYHLAPDNGRLVWDRLPMTIGFMGLLAAILGERVSARTARRLFVPLLAAGALSVGWWGWTESRGAGDLRAYGLVQFGSLAIVVLALVLYRLPGSGTAYLVAALASYGAAKIFEALDAPIFAVGKIVSGHTLKHIVAAAGLWLVALMLQRRARMRAWEGT